MAGRVVGCAGVKMALWRVARYSLLGSSCKLVCLVLLIQKAKGLPRKGLPLFGGENGNRSPGSCSGIQGGLILDA